ncbi:ABC transporter permease [Cohnella mopanensis]|uniref:ABC transporter permease n=1 Tax=Cohnella mopanensis TaxID=2911966 RepID=UPI001EF77C65|nr:ABC transporter permease [Cohnella mopanensis]
MSSLIIAQLNIRRTIGSHKGFISFVLIPILVISAIVGIFGSSSNDKVNIAVRDEDGGWLSKQIISSMLSIDTYQVNEPTGSLVQLKQEVYDGNLGAVVYIPSGFTDSLLVGGDSAVQLFRKSEQLWNVSLGITLTEVTERIVRSVRLASEANPNPQQKVELVRKLLDQQQENPFTVKSEQLVHRNNNAYILVIGLMLMFVMIMVNQSIHGIIEDRENRTMARIFSAPVRAWEIAWGNFLGCLLLGTFQLVLILTGTRYVLGFDFGVSFGELLVIMEFFLLAAIGISTAAAGLIKNFKQIGSINHLVVIPTCMLGGCFWSTSMMPDFMQKLSNFVPQRWAIVALERVSSGATLSEVSLEIGILLLFAVVLLAYGAYVLKPSQS